MKKIIGFILFLGVAASISLYSCQKKSVKPAAAATYPFDGYWYGSDLDPNTKIIANEGILFRPGGTLRVYDFTDNPTTQTDTTHATAVGNGTYTVINATSVSVTYTFSQVPGTFTGTVTFNAGFTQLTFVYTAGSTGNTRLAQLTKQ